MASTFVAPAAASATLPRPAFGPVGSTWKNLLFVLPFLTVYIVLLILPLFAGIGLSLFKADLFGVERFVGLSNFMRLASDETFLQTVVNTFAFVVMTVVPLTAIGLGLALLLNRETRFSAALRAVFFSSTVLSVTIVALIWRMVFIPEGGLIAEVRAMFGALPINFLNNEALALPAVAATTIWWCLGLPMMLFLAALQQVPREIYEAAALDRTSRWRTLWRITLPSIRRTIVLVVVMQVILQFQVFGQAQLMTLGGPNNASRPMVLWIYETGFRRWDLGYAAAAAQVLFLLILAIALVQFRVAGQKER
ncbi:MAG TPA: sugar ABC transporter permease [Sphingomicrobium sp.]|jgi:multiple sugar transport system permease protein